MNIEDELRSLKIPDKLNRYIGEYYLALCKRSEVNLVGETEYRCFKRFLDQYNSGKYKFAEKSMARMFKFLSYLLYRDEEGKLHRLKLYPVQRFIMCAIFGLRKPDGGYVVNTANLYMARRNGKSFLLSAVLHYIMSMSKFKNERIILASCKGQTATICFDEFAKFIDNNELLQEVYSSISRTGYWAKQKETGNKLELFRTGASAKKQLDGFTNKVAVIDEECLCDKIIAKTIQDGQAHFKDSLLVTMSTAQFDVGGDNHKKWLQVRKELYENALPDNHFLFLCEPDQEDLASKSYANIRTWGKANPVLLFASDGYTIKDHIRRKYIQNAKQCVSEKGFELQNFVTKQCNVWYSAEERNICTFDQMTSCRGSYSFEDVINAGYTDWYLGLDLSQTQDLSSVCWCCYVGVDEQEHIVPYGELYEAQKLFVHVVNWMPKNKLQQHINNDRFCYFDYVDRELFLCDGGGGDNIDIQQIFDYIEYIRTKHELYYVTVTADPYNVSGIQSKLADICGTFILQDQSAKALSQYIEALSKQFKEQGVMYHEGSEDILEKAITNAVLVRNTNGYYSLEKITLRADSDIRIDPLDCLLDAFIACYIDHSNETSSDEMADSYIKMFS